MIWEYKNPKQTYKILMRTHENVTNNLSYRGHVCCAKRFFTLGTICGTNTKSLFAMSTMFATHASTQICSEVKNFLLFFYSSLHSVLPKMAKITVFYSSTIACLKSCNLVKRQMWWGCVNPWQKFCQARQISWQCDCLGKVPYNSDWLSWEWNAMSYTTVFSKSDQL